MNTFLTFSNRSSFRIFMTLVAQFNLELNQIYARTTFLNGHHYEEVYIHT